MPLPRRRAATAAGLTAVAALTAAGCSSSGGTPNPLSAVHGTPNIRALLAQPVATPSVCPSTQNGTTSGRASPWVGTVDVSVYLKLTDRGSAVAALGARLRREPLVAKVYFESKREAYAEFARLYTCSAQVKPGQLPASYRVVLRSGATVGQRNALVARLQQDPAVRIVACDPSAPCVGVVRSVDPSITARPSARPRRSPRH